MLPGMDSLRDLDLPQGALVLVDTAPIIYYVEEGPASPRGSVLGAFIETARAGRLSLMVSAIAWTELLAGPLASRASARADEYRTLLADSRTFRVEPVEVSIAEEAARLVSRLRRSLALADALHLATALALRADAALTNDEAWREAVPGLRVFLVDEIAY
jgi:predicted nucleic acid-binding protein